MAVVSMPLVAVTVLHASTFVVGVLQAIAWLPALVVGLPAGALVDRLPKRPLMLVCDAVSFALFASVPVVAWMGLLTVGQLVAVALLGGAARVFFGIAFGPYLRMITEIPERPEANAKIEASASAAQVAGPGLGGLFAQFFGATSWLFVNGLTFAFSAFCLMRINVKNPQPASRGKRRASLWAEIGEGVNFVARDPYLRVITLYMGLGNLGDAMFEAIVIVFLVRTVGASPGIAGGLVAAISLGGILGALLAAPIGRRFGTARGTLLCVVVASPFTLLLPLTNRTAGLGFFVVGGIVYLIGIGAANVMLASFSQTYVPSELVGRNSATVTLVSRGSMPLGGLVGAVLGEACGPRIAILATALAITLSVGVLFIGPMRRQRDLPLASMAATELVAK
jgi:MFS family permease